MNCSYTGLVQEFKNPFWAEPPQNVTIFLTAYFYALHSIDEKKGHIDVTVSLGTLWYDDRISDKFSKCSGQKNITIAESMVGNMWLGKAYAVSGMYLEL